MQAFLDKLNTIDQKNKKADNEADEIIALEDLIWHSADCCTSGDMLNAIEILKDALNAKMKKA